MIFNNSNLNFPLPVILSAVWVLSRSFDHDQHPPRYIQLSRSFTSDRCTVAGWLWLIWLMRYWHPQFSQLSWHQNWGFQKFFNKSNATDTVTVPWCGNDHIFKARSRITVDVCCLLLDGIWPAGVFCWEELFNYRFTNNWLNSWTILLLLDHVTVENQLNQWSSMTGIVCQLIKTDINYV